MSEFVHPEQAIDVVSRASMRLGQSPSDSLRRVLDGLSPSDRFDLGFALASEFDRVIEEVIYMMTPDDFEAFH